MNQYFYSTKVIYVQDKIYHDLYFFLMRKLKATLFKLDLL